MKAEKGVIVLLIDGAGSCSRASLTQTNAAADLLWFISFFLFFSKMLKSVNFFKKNYNSNLLGSF
jgi:hypothetical protein